MFGNMELGLVKMDSDVSRKSAQFVKLAKEKEAGKKPVIQAKPAATIKAPVAAAPVKKSVVITERISSAKPAGGNMF